MSQQRKFHGVGGNYKNDTTYTKIFVGGLAWETQRDTMKKYFEQFGEILEAVVITDKTTGRSKGYGFVTFKDTEAAFRACQNPSPIIDGRRANCNLASLGAQINRSPTHQHGSGPGGRFRTGPGLMSTPPTYPGSSSSTFFHQPPFPYSTYGYSGYSHDTMYNMNYYGVYGQQFSPYYPTSGGGGGASGTVGYFHNFLPYYGPYAQSNHAQSFGMQYPQMVQQYPFLPQQHHFTSSGILSLPTSTMPLPSTTTTAVTSTIISVLGGSGADSEPTTGAQSDQNSST